MYEGRIRSPVAVRSPVKTRTMMLIQPGLAVFPGRLDRREQEDLAGGIAHIIEAAPLFTPRMPRTGKLFSVRMTNCGGLGWVSDASGYRYQPLHPETGRPWPAIPVALLALWEEVSGYPAPPEACLVNVYGGGARMGLHQDRDEENLAAPVVSVSLGATCLFRVGGTQRGGPTRSFRLSSGDVVVLGGESRLAFHGVDRVLEGTSTLLPDGGRINLTLRRVTKA
jgi:DNA oxidative demethylase